MKEETIEEIRNLPLTEIIRLYVSGVLHDLEVPLEEETRDTGERQEE